MKATKKLLVAAVAAGGTLVGAEAEAQSSTERGTSRAAAAPRSGGTTGDTGARHSGRGSGHNHDGQGHRGHGPRWHGHWGGHGRYWGGGYRHWYPRWGFYFGVPVFWSSWYWGGPYWHDYYPGGTLVYREVERGAAFPEGEIRPAETTQIPRGGQLPPQGPLYMNYCESAKAYFPKVTTCPEGWKLATPTN